MQSSLEEALRERGVNDGTAPRPSLWRQFLRFLTHLMHPGSFSPGDPDWVLKIAEAVLGQLARGNHAFNPEPAHSEISDSARLLVVGDWGTGLPRAQDVARYLAQEIAEALAQGREAHVVHLGDIYYSGLPSEIERHVLAYWPVTPEQTKAGVTSWSLNGNHDMYSGGFGYFDTLLADPRFAAQHSADGQGTSFFRLNASWDFVGLDTSWSSDVLARGSVGRLEDPQAEFVMSVAAASNKKLVLFSHHQLVSVFDREDIGTELPAKLRPVLEQGRVTGWWWGHEHRCMGFEATHGVTFPRCLGHGGVPVLQGYVAEESLKRPGAWADSGCLDSGGQHLARFGFAVFDLAGDRIDVRYRDDTGAVIRTEVIR